MGPSIPAIRLIAYGSPSDENQIPASAPIKKTAIWDLY